MNPMLETVLCSFDVNDFNLLNKVVYGLGRMSNKSFMNHPN